MHFDELLSYESIEEVQKMAEEKRVMNECEELKEKIRRIKDTLNYKFKEVDNVGVSIEYN